MFNSNVLDVAIGMAFVYLLLSLLCSAAAEVLAGIFDLRAKNLEAGIRSLFSDGFAPGGNAFVREIYEHGLVRGLYRDGALDLVPTKNRPVTTHYSEPSGNAGKKLPSYIPARTFALALLDILASGSPLAAANGATPPNLAAANQAAANQGAANPPDVNPAPANQATSNSPGANPAAPNSPAADPAIVMASIERTLNSLAPSSAKEALRSLLLTSNNEIAKLQTNFENWYNDAMDRAAGWYKRQNQWVLLGLGLFVAVLANANSVTLARVLWVDPGVRNATVESAGAYIKANPNSPTADAATIKACREAETDPNDAGKADACSNGLKSDLDLMGKKINALSDAESKTLLPIGWKQPLWEGSFFTPYRDGRHTIILAWTLVGWFMTAIALSLGAPFWFDLLNKFMVVRSTIKPQEKSQIEKSKD